MMYGVGYLKAKKASGFTIVELLIVIVVIAILAAITIVAYNGIQTRAKTTALQSDAANASKTLEAFRFNATNPSELYPANATTAALATSANTTATYTSYNANKGYCAQFVNNDLSYYITAGSTPKEGTCRAITNLVTNPSLENASAVAWGTANGATWARTASTELYGATVARVTTPNNSVDSGLSVPTPNVTAGTAYTASITIKAITAGPYSLSVQGAAGAGSADRANRNLAAGERATLYVTWTPSTSGSIAFYALRQAGTAGVHSFDVDGAMLYTNTAQAPYADGDNTNWVWSGTTQASTSTGPIL